MRMRHAKPQRGFSLLEVLVAFAIAAIALGIMMRIFSDGFHLSRTSEDYSRATVLAESLLAQIGPEYMLEGAPYTGTFDDRFNWQVDLKPYVLDDAFLGTSQHNSSLINIALDVSWSEGLKKRHYRLSSLRLMPNTVK